MMEKGFSHVARINIIWFYIAQNQENEVRNCAMSRLPLKFQFNEYEIDVDHMNP